MDISALKCFLKKAAFLVGLLFVLMGLLPENSPAADTLEVVTGRAQSYYYGQGVKRNLHRAFILYLEAARRGDPDSMLVVGGMYMQGEGVAENRKEGFKWLYKAANNGSSSKESQRVIGQFLLAGEGVPVNYKEAAHWYELAAEGGDAEAQSELAYLYFFGDKVERDYDKAHKWFRLAAENGYGLAQYNMGILWYTGSGVPEVDFGRAYAWFSLAAASGYQNGDVAKKFLETQLSAEELQQAQEYASYLYKEIESMNE